MSMKKTYDWLKTSVAKKSIYRKSHLDFPVEVGYSFPMAYNNCGTIIRVPKIMLPDMWDMISQSHKVAFAFSNAGSLDGATVEYVETSARAYGEPDLSFSTSTSNLLHRVYRIPPRPLVRVKLIFSNAGQVELGLFHPHQLPVDFRELQKSKEELRQLKFSRYSDMDEQVLNANN